MTVGTEQREILQSRPRMTCKGQWHDVMTFDIALAQRPVPCAVVEAADLACEPPLLPERCRLLPSDDGLVALALTMKPERKSPFFDLVLTFLRRRRIGSQVLRAFCQHLG